VTWANIGSIALRTQALVAGRVDITTFSVEDAGIIENDPNLHVVYMPVPGTEWVPNVSWWTRTAVTDDPAKDEAIQRFRTVMIEISRRAVDDKEWFFDMMRTQYPDDTREFADEELEVIWERFSNVVCVNGCMRLLQVENYIENTFLPENPDTPSTFVWQDLMEPKYVATTLGEIGVYPDHQDQPELTLPS
jgi:hypothetical protein